MMVSEARYALRFEKNDVSGKYGDRHKGAFFNPYLGRWQKVTNCLVALSREDIELHLFERLAYRFPKGNFEQDKYTTLSTDSIFYIIPTARLAIQSKRLTQTRTTILGKQDNIHNIDAFIL